MIGRVLGNRYEILEKIGEGGMAEVYKAKCKLLNRFVAVKMLKSEYSHDADFVEKFKMEATASAILSSNNIVGIYDVGSEGDINYIVMELVTGVTLKELIKKKGSLSVEETLHVAIQIARAIDCAHKSGIIHRDIKPQNILVTNDGVIKVTDFGIAKAINSATITNTTRVIGSAHYFSPEQAKGSVVDGRTDIYSLGIVIYEMLTGRVPYEAESAVTVALKHIQEEAIPPMKLNISIPKSVNDLVLKAISKEALRRYQSMKEMIDDMISIKNNKDVVIELHNEDSDDYTRVMKPISPNELKQYAQVKTLENRYNTSSNSKEEEEDYDEYTNKDKNKNKKQNIILGTSIGIASVIIIILGIFIFKMISGANNNEVSVPSILGLDKYEAQQKIEEYGLKFYIESEDESIKPKDEVIGCNPREGEKVQKGTTVRVKVSKGQDETVTVKDFRNISLEDAKSQILALGLEVGEIKQANSNDVPKDHVISQSIGDGTKVEPKTKISLVISQGKEIKKVSVVSVVDRTIGEAELVFNALKLKIGNKVTVVTNDETLKDKIISQSIAKDTEVPEGTAIDLTYYKYEKKIVEDEDKKPEPEPEVKPVP